jgi:hypothetical protein
MGYDINYNTLPFYHHPYAISGIHGYISSHKPIGVRAPTYILPIRIYLGIQAHN